MPAMVSPSRWKLTVEPVFSAPMLQHIKDVKDAKDVKDVKDVKDIKDAKFSKFCFQSSDSITSSTCVLSAQHQHSEVLVKLREDQEECEC